nr:hypothetical protein [Acidobacteriota bacterium]NIQ83598.1 hypothetical protein [Acidobacteriota bacterium]
SAEGPLYRWQARLGARLLAESQAADERRAHHARRLIRAVARCAGWTVPAAAAIAAGPLRLPLLAPGRVARDRTRARLLRMGVDASVMYPATINRIPGIGPHLAGSATTGGAQQLVDRLLTLPTYPTLAGGDLRRIEDAFVSAAESS